MSQDKENLANTIIMPVTKLRMSHRNPRKITKESLEALKSEIQRDPEFLLKRPILVNKVNGLYIVYAGTQRLTACMELGMEDVPVRVEENLSKELLDYRMLLDNKHRGEFDLHKVVNIEGAAEILANIDEFKDGEFGITKKNKAQKLVYTKFYFNTREELGQFYELLSQLQEMYPDETLSQRLIKYMSQTI